MSRKLYHAPHPLRHHLHLHLRHPGPWASSPAAAPGENLRAIGHADGNTLPAAGQHFHSGLVRSSRQRNTRSKLEVQRKEKRIVFYQKKKKKTLYFLCKRDFQTSQKLLFSLWLRAAFWPYRWEALLSADAQSTHGHMAEWSHDLHGVGCSTTLKHKHPKKQNSLKRNKSH